MMVNMLRKKNEQYGGIKFVDISSNDYNAKENQGLDYETVMGRIHAILSDGAVVTDIDASRKLYEAVGLGWVYAITKYEPIATLADAVYHVWAKYRLQITGRPPLEEVLEARKIKVCFNHWVYVLFLFNYTTLLTVAVVFIQLHNAIFSSCYFYRQIL
ncbi:hypothetical protein NMG60_11004392 [Bertholletia excelsa]